MNTMHAPDQLTSEAVRRRLVEALELDLIGPWPGHAYADEKLPGWVRPSNWYHSGFLIPAATAPDKRASDDEDDDFNEVGEDAGLPEESNEERKAAKKAYFPSSMGLSFLLPKGTTTFDVTVCWGDYEASEITDAEGKPLQVWQRIPREEKVPVTLTGRIEPAPQLVPNSRGLRLTVIERDIAVENLEEHLPNGTRSASIFLVNHRHPDTDQPDRQYVFQPQLEVCSPTPFVARPDLRGINASDRDEQVSDLHYADKPEYATGHGVSAEWDLKDRACHRLRTRWIPTAEVERTEAAIIEDVELAMGALADLPDGAAASAALMPLVMHYRSWIEKQGSKPGGMNQQRRETAVELLRLAGVAADRIEKGIATLQSNPDALDAFRIANRAVAGALKNRLQVANPQWRPFQLAFILLNLPGIADPTERNRQTVDLLFFPTGAARPRRTSGSQRSRWSFGACATPPTTATPARV